MTSAPLVSVLMPCFNAGETLPATLASLAAQTLVDFEIVAVDDGSDDATWDVLTAFAAREPRLRPLRIAHGGIVPALNAGLAACHAPLIARMDADDICLPGRLEAQASLFAAAPELAVVSCRVRFGGCREASGGYAAYIDWINSLATHEEMFRSRFVEAPLAHPSAMLRREALRAVGGYREGRFPEDYELWLRLFAAGARFAKHPDELLVWNDPPGRLSRTHENYAPDAFDEVKADHLAAWLAESAPSWPEIILWGAGKGSRRRMAPLLAQGARVAAYVDIDPNKVGNRIAGVPVIAPDGLPAPGPAFLLTAVGSRGARAEIGAWLEAHGWLEGVHFLHAA